MVTGPSRCSLVTPPPVTRVDAARPGRPVTVVVRRPRRSLGHRSTVRTPRPPSGPDTYEVSGRSRGARTRGDVRTRAVRHARRPRDGVGSAPRRARLPQRHRRAARKTSRRLSVLRPTLNHAMQDFPPRHRPYLDARASVAAVDSVDRPDTRSPAAFLLWIVRDQRGVLAVSLPRRHGVDGAADARPVALGKTIGAGIGVARRCGRDVVLDHVARGRHDRRRLPCGILFHTLIVRSWLLALYGTTHLVANKTLQLGPVPRRRTPTGEVLSVSGSDGDQFGSFLEILVARRAVRRVCRRRGDRAVGVAALGLLLLLGRTPSRARGRPSPAAARAVAAHRALAQLRSPPPRRPTSSPGCGSCAASAARRPSATTSSAGQRVRHAGVVAGVWRAVIDAIGVLPGILLVGPVMYLGVREVPLRAASRWASSSPSSDTACSSSNRCAVSSSSRTRRRGRSSRRARRSPSWSRSRRGAPRRSRCASIPPAISSTRRVDSALAVGASRCSSAPRPTRRPRWPIGSGAICPGAPRRP